MELAEKANVLRSRTISRDLIGNFSTITGCKFDEIVEFVQYWRDKGDFDGVKEYITFRCETGINARIRASIAKQKEESHVKQN